MLLLLQGGELLRRQVHVDAAKAAHAILERLALEPKDLHLFFALALSFLGSFSSSFLFFPCFSAEALTNTRAVWVGGASGTLTGSVGASKRAGDDRHAWLGGKGSWRGCVREDGDG